MKGEKKLLDLKEAINVFLQSMYITGVAYLAIILENPKYLLLWILTLVIFREEKNR